MLVIGINPVVIDLLATKVASLQMEIGTILLARISSLGNDGQGVMRLTGGEEMNFTGGQTLQLGEQVRLQVTGLSPTPSLKLLDSESAIAGRLAQNVHQTAASGSEIINNLLHWTETPPPTGPEPRPTTPPPTGPEPRSTTPLSPGNLSPQPSPGTVAPLPASPVDASGKGSPPVVPTATESGGPPGPATGDKLLLSPSPPPLPSRLPAQPAPNLGNLQELAPTTMVNPRTSFLWFQTAAGLPPPTASPPLPVTNATGEPLASALQRILPTLTLDKLLQGDGQAVRQLLDLTADPRQTVKQIHQLRQLAADLRYAAPAPDADPLGRTVAPATTGGETAPTEAQDAVNRLADLLSSQKLLSSNPAGTNPHQVIGYQMFWVREGGIGELIWQRDQEKPGGASAGEAVTTVLISLQLTGLGPIQAKLILQDQQLRIGIAARDEAALQALREGIGGLRERLQTAGLPLRSLDLNRLTDRELQQVRQSALGLGPGFNTEA